MINRYNINFLIFISTMFLLLFFVAGCFVTMASIELNVKDIKKILYNSTVYKTNKD